MRTRKSLDASTPEPAVVDAAAPRSTRKRAPARDEVDAAATEEDSAPPKRRRASRFAEDVAGAHRDEAKASPAPPVGNSNTKRRAPNGRPQPDRKENIDVGGGDVIPNGTAPPAAEKEGQDVAAQTPTRRKPGRPPKTRPAAVEGFTNGEASTPSKSRVGAAAAVAAASPARTPKTPVKQTKAYGLDTPRRRELADRSARRKSVRTLIDRVVAGATSDDDDEDGLTREIYGSSEEEDDEEDGPDNVDGAEPREKGQKGGGEKDTESPAPDPSATPTHRRPGRPKGSGVKAAAARRKRSPTPPQDLPPHELYFYQNRPGAANHKTSGNRLASIGLELLTHDEYFALARAHRDRHADDVQALLALHAESFPQWALELSQGFGVCLYGYGSKLEVLRRFATALFRADQRRRRRRGRDGDGGGPGGRIVVVNGYVRAANLVRETLLAIGRAVAGPGYRPPASTNPVAAVGALGGLLASTDTTVTLIVNSIDAPPMRRGSTSSSAGASSVSAQAVLAQLAALRPRVRLVCSADTPDFALMWDASLRSLFNFVFHDCTTFAPPSAAEADVVDDVHELLGRRARRAGGKDGVVFVLRSLPENAKSLFRLLVTEVLVALDEGDTGDTGGFAESPGVEYRMLYNKAVEEFICSSEMAFRTLLKEFHDHQIISSRKDPLGTELLCLPFTKEELEGILEDLMS